MQGAWGLSRERRVIKEWAQSRCSLLLTGRGLSGTWWAMGVAGGRPQGLLKVKAAGSEMSLEAHPGAAEDVEEQPQTTTLVQAASKRGIRGLRAANTRLPVLSLHTM